MRRFLSCGWAVILEEPLDAALANVEILRRYAAVLLVVGLAVGAVIIAWVSSKMTGPIRELREGVATIGAGNLEHRTSIKTGDEIQDLADEFNKMTDALQNSYATLRAEGRTEDQGNISALRSYDCGESVLGSRGYLERSHRKDHGDVSL